ncbi:MAG: HAMP domain-containing protein, partial [Deltaproteobacteria bacterium]|nr:HAMP domain-containing protein [Deltaproteobacteria bacterium]
LMARSLTRRLRAIAEVASAVAGGELEREPEVDHAGDELSTVAHAFSAMLQQIRSLISNMQQMAKSENERLQGLVRAATAEVSAANDKLRAASEFLQEVYKAMPSALVVFDAEGRIQAANQASEALFERPQRELVGADLTALFEAPAASELLALARTQALLRGEKVGLSKSGQGLPVFVSATTLGQGAGGAPRGVVCVVLDLREQKRLELELRQAQKLESVGRLAAGIAHEINTPVQFVSDSVHFVQTAMEDLGNILTQQHAVVQAVIEGQGSAEQAQAALDVEAELDLEYLRENVPKALARSVDGLGRIAEIVRSMKAFAHPDQKDMGLADLNKAIESTIVIARNEYKYVADAHLALEKLPLVSCHLGEVNQVVLNIVVNAAHAIGDRMRATGARGNIWVATRTEGASVVISIRDDGGGIPKAIRERVFDPFFTTKEVGRGTGQGLAIARSVIVDKHKGELTFESEEGVGTTFFIKLPIEQLAAKAA